MRAARFGAFRALRVGKRRRIGVAFVGDLVRLEEFTRVEALMAKFAFRGMSPVIRATASAFGLATTTPITRSAHGISAAMISDPVCLLCRSRGRPVGRTRIPATATTSRTSGWHGPTERDTSKLVMHVTKTILLVLGIVGVLVGLVWVGQGSGHFPYPKSSFMLDQRSWMYRGFVLALAGLVTIVVSRRLR